LSCTRDCTCVFPVPLCLLWYGVRSHACMEASSSWA
jgi:hypothetical protein